MLKILDDNRYLFDTRNVKGDPHGTNWIHLATIEKTIPFKASKRYIAFKDRLNGKCYIEELDRSGQLQFIEDDEEALEVAKFLDNQKLLEVFF